MTNNIQKTDYKNNFYSDFMNVLKLDYNNFVQKLLKICLQSKQSDF